MDKALFIRNTVQPRTHCLRPMIHDESASSIYRLQWKSSRYVGYKCNATTYLCEKLLSHGFCYGHPFFILFNHIFQNFQKQVYRSYPFCHQLLRNGGLAVPWWMNLVRLSHCNVWAPLCRFCAISRSLSSVRRDWGPIIG
jgi:hypothetical protein